MRAAHQRDLANQAIEDMYTQVAEKWLAGQPRLQPLQREFLEKALRYYQDFARDDAADPEARLATGRAYLRVVLRQEGGRMVARSAGGQASSQLRPLAASNALLIVPEGEPAGEAGATYDALLLGAIT